MINIPLAKFLRRLKEDFPRLDIHASGVTIVLVDKAQTIALLRRDEQKSTFIPAEVYGFCLYHYADFDIRLNWKVLPAQYKGVNGVNLEDQITDLVDINLLYKGKIARLYDPESGKMIDEANTLSILKQRFTTIIQDWKLHPFLSAHMMQPTHFRVTQEIIPDTPIEVIQELEYKTYPQLKKYVTDNGGHRLITTFSQHVSVENQFVCMEGFSTYSLGDPKEGYFAHLHWLVRGSCDLNSPFEIAVVESDNLPGAFLTGVGLIDNIDEGHDVLSIMRLLKFDQNWQQQAIRLVKTWLKERNQHHQNQANAETNTTTDDTKINYPLTTHRPRERQNHKNNDKPIQMGFFNDDRVGKVGKGSYDYQKYTVFNGPTQLNFSGRHIAQVVGNKNANGEVNIFDLYKTDNNDWVGVKRQVSLMGDHLADNNSHAQYLENKEQLFDFFAQEVAKDLYNQAQRDTDQHHKKEN